MSGNDEVVLKALDLLERETQNARRVIEDQVSAVPAAPAAAAAAAEAPAPAVPPAVQALGAQLEGAPQPPPGRAPLLSVDEAEKLPQHERISRMDEIDFLVEREWQS
jgi:hypothetical protein